MITSNINYCYNTSHIKTSDQGFQPRYEDNSDVVALIDGRGGMLDMLDEDTQKRGSS